MLRILFLTILRNLTNKFVDIASDKLITIYEGFKFINKSQITLIDSVYEDSKYSL